MNRICVALIALSICFNISIAQKSYLTPKRIEKKENQQDVKNVLNELVQAVYNSNYVRIMSAFSPILSPKEGSLQNGSKPGVIGLKIDNITVQKQDNNYAVDCLISDGVQLSNTKESLVVKFIGGYPKIVKANKLRAILANFLRQESERAKQNKNSDKLSNNITSVANSVSSAGSVPTLQSTSTVSSFLLSTKALIRTIIPFEGDMTINRQLTQANFGKDLFSNPIDGAVVVPDNTDDFLVFMIDAAWNRIVYGSFNNNWIKSYGDNTGDFHFQIPQAITADRYGHIFLIDGISHQIIRLQYSSQSVTYVGSYSIAGTADPVGISNNATRSFPTDNGIWVADDVANKLFYLGIDGTLQATITSIVNDFDGTSVTLTSPSCVLVHENYGDKYISIIDNLQSRIITIYHPTVQGNSIHGEKVGITQFTSSCKVSLASLGVNFNGDLFAVDSRNQMIHIIGVETLNGYITSVKQVDAADQWNYPRGIGGTTMSNSYEDYYSMLSLDDWSDTYGINSYFPGTDFLNTGATSYYLTDQFFGTNVGGILTNASSIILTLYNSSGATVGFPFPFDRKAGDGSLLISKLFPPGIWISNLIGTYRAHFSILPEGNDYYYFYDKETGQVTHDYRQSPLVKDIWFAFPITGSLSGTSSGITTATGSWTLQVNSGSGSFSYQWYRQSDGSNTWTTLGTSSSQSATIGPTSFTIRCDVTDNFNSWTKTFTYHVSSITTSGSLSSNEIWPDNVTLQGTVTVPSGFSLTISGSTVQFPSGASLIVNGNLYAEGSTFTSTGSTSPGSWGSIQLSGSGASGSSISYANIQYGTEVDINQASNVTIQNCNITDNSGNGIYLYFASNCLLQNNTIANSNVYHGLYVNGGSSNNCYNNVIYKYANVSPGYHNGAGILYSGCGGNIWQNDIRYYNWGVGTIWGASPDFMSYDNWGMNNRITDCSYGVMVYQQSYPIIGPDLADDIEHYAGNSIYNNAKEVALNVSYSTVSNLWANGVWWGSDPPNLSLFQIGSGSYISGLRAGDGRYGEEYYLESDPWSGIPLPRAAENGNGVLVAQPKEQRGGVNKKNGITPKKNSAVNTSVYTPKGTLYDGIQLRLQHKYKEAKNFFIDYLQKNPKDQAAYVELYNCYNKETAADIINYFSSLPSSAAKEQKLLLANLYLMSQRDGLVQDGIAKAKKVNDDLVSENKNTALAEKAKLNKFYIALYNENDPESAAAILSDALSTPSLSTDMELSDAKAALTNYINPKTGEKSGARLLAKMSEPLPTTYGIDQNFPNPFNPSTTINYQLPENGHVLIKVYDVLGRDVQTLVNEDKPVGRYSVEFDASKLSSGVYFYSMRAGNYTSVKKMLLTK